MVAIKKEMLKTRFMTLFIDYVVEYFKLVRE